MRTAPRRVLLISTHGYVAPQPPLGKADTGGQTLFVLEVARALARRNIVVDLFTRRFGGQPADERVGDNVMIRRVPCGGDEFIPKERLHRHIAEWSDRAVERIRAEGWRYEWVNSHYWDAGLAGLKLAAQLERPHIFTPHSLGEWKRMNTPGSAEELETLHNFALRIAAEREICRRASLVIATTADQADVLCDHPYRLPRRAIRAIAPGFDPARFHPDPIMSREDRKRSLGWKGKTVFTLGRVAENKGYDLLIRAMPRILNSCPDARLVLGVGGATLSSGEAKVIDDLRMLAADLNVAARTMFAGHVPDDALPEAYRAADAFVLPSRYEPFGMTALEAMACGAPTVVSSRGGLAREIRGRGAAVVVDPVSTRELAEGVSLLLCDRLLTATIASRGSQLARERYTWDSVALELLSAAQDLDRAAVAKRTPGREEPAWR